VPQQTVCSITSSAATSAKGWAQLFLKEQPWSYSRRSTKHDYEQAALRQGQVAVSTALRGNYRGRSSFTNAASIAWQSLSGLLQNFYHLVRIVQRVHRHIGEKLSANHGGREAAQVNSRVGKLPSQLRGDARPVTA
jgi:hypothetical protein